MAKSGASAPKIFTAFWKVLGGFNPAPDFFGANHRVTAMASYNENAQTLAHPEVLHLQTTPCFCA